MISPRRTLASRSSFLLIVPLLVGACVSRPKIVGTQLAPPKLRCDHPGDEECDEYRADYLANKQVFTCAERATDDCQPPIVTASGDYFMDASLVYRFAGERGDAGGRDPESTKRPYELGLALAGGGTKAASYAIGILAGLYNPSNRGLSERLDAVSSVSGGSYAAVWYFSRLLDDYQIASEHVGNKRFQENYAFRDVFKDCLPLSYRALAALPDDQSDPALCAPTASQFDPSRPDEDPYRFQNHLRGFHDVFSKDFNLPPESNDEDHDRAVWQGIREFAYSLPLLPVHWVANGLFDSRANLSFSGRRYFNGIARTYSYRPVDCRQLADLATDTKDPRWLEPCTGSRGRPSPNVESARGHTMSALANLYYHQEGEKRMRGERAQRQLPRIPFWIANTTAGVERHRGSFGAGGLPDLEDSAFEFTPYGFGSRHFGRWVGSPPNLELAKIAGASGAFLDAQQRTLHPWQNMLGSAGMSLLAASWGVNIPNPRWRDEVRLQHYFLPFPFYWLHHDAESNDGAWIHLSDGGQSEDTGAWALIRRGVRTILIADESYDGHGRFEDLCLLRKQLSGHGLHLRVVDLEDFEEVCTDNRSNGNHYDLWQWPVRYLRGCVTSDATDTACATPGATYFARLLVLKPGIDLPTLRPYLQRCDPKALTQPRDATACRAALEDLRGHNGYEAFPAELFGFLVRNLRDHEPTVQSFPQNSTVWMTLNSSPTLYGAYRELATWHMHGIAEEIDHPSHTAPAAVPLVRAPR